LFRENGKRNSGSPCPAKKGQHLQKGEMAKAKRISRGSGRGSLGGGGAPSTTDSEESTQFLLQTSLGEGVHVRRRCWVGVGVFGVGVLG